MRTQAPELLTRAEALQVRSDADLSLAGELARAAAALKKNIRALFVKPKRKADEAKQAILDEERGLLAPLERADALLRRKMEDYVRERQRQAREEAERRAAEERRRREDEAVSQAARLEDLAHATGDEHYQRAAEQTLAAPVRPPTAAVAPPRVDGVGFRKRDPKVQVLDLTALARAVADGRVPPQAILPNQRWLDLEAKQRGPLYDVPGTAVIEDDTPRTTVRA